jgi:predicted DCC family thiol-disulfide oxidoreductase YuxK
MRVYRDRQIRLAGNPQIYGWSRYACWLTIALAYEAAALSKLRNGGPFWWHATNMRAILYWGSLNPMPFNWGLSLRLSHAPDVLFAAAGLMVLFVELSFISVAFSPAARRILPAAAVLIHLGIWFLQNVFFFDFILLQLVFVDLLAVQQGLTKRLAARGQIHVLFDGACPLCRRTVRLLARLDLFRRLEFIDFRQLDLTAYNHRYAFHLTLDRLTEEMHIVARGMLYRGFFGYRRIALALPATWPIVPWLFLPGVSWLGARAYRYVAGRRLLALTCDSECGIAPTEERGPLVSVVKRPTSQSLLPALGISTLVAIALLVWVGRIESYPLTAWQMYSYYWRQAVYYKVLARDESGTTSRANFERALPALTDNRFSDVAEMCFTPGKIPICEESFRAIGSAINKRATPGHKVTALTVQVWSWDFRSNPADPAHGNLVRSYQVDMASPIRR